MKEQKDPVSRGREFGPFLRSILRKYWRLFLCEFSKIPIRVLITCISHMNSEFPTRHKKAFAVLIMRCRAHIMAALSGYRNLQEKAVIIVNFCQSLVSLDSWAKFWWQISFSVLLHFVTTGISAELTAAATVCFETRRFFWTFSGDPSSLEKFWRLMMKA